MGRLQDHPEGGDSRHEHWREVIEITRRPAGARWNAVTSCAERTAERGFGNVSERFQGEQIPKARSCSCHAIGPFPSIPASFSSFGCRASRITSRTFRACQTMGRPRWRLRSCSRDSWRL
jgi:hypothetical protein